MAKCPVCLAKESHEELVDEVFQIDGRYWAGQRCSRNGVLPLR